MQDCRLRFSQTEFPICTSLVIHLVCTLQFFKFLLRVTVVLREIEDNAYTEYL